MDVLLQARTRWSALALPVRRILLAMLFASFVGTTILLVRSNAPRVALFASPLHAEQLSEVQNQLAAWNVAFTPNANNVVVDASQRNALLLRLSLAGIPHAFVRTTDDALAGVGVLTPQAVIDAQTRAGLAGDIAIGLRDIDGVDDARVIIAPAKIAQFADQSSQAATASVRLKLHPGAILAAGAVAGIRAFVASSVPGLAPGHVVILDDRGIAFDQTAASSDPSSLQASLQSALDAAFGVGTTIVRVRIERDRRTIVRSDTQRSPLRGGPIAMTTQSESYNGSGKAYARHDEKDDRGSTIASTVVHAPPGAIARISTAVFVDELRAADLAKVRELAAATVAYNPGRGDRLEVQAIDFTHQRAPKRDLWWLLYGAIVPLLPALAIAFGAIVVARIVMPVLRDGMQGAFERASLARASRDVSGYTPARVHSALAHEPPHAAAAIISALPAATAAAVLELYPTHERDEIVRRMQRRHSPLVPGADEVMAQHA